MQRVIQLAARVTDATYGHVSQSLHVSLSADPVGVVGDESYWRGAVVAAVGDELVGVVLAARDRIEDLWIEAAFHGRGLGTQLLAIAENAIRASGHQRANLNVVLQNTRAIRFYERNGWIRGEQYWHEKWDFSMMRMSKRMAG